MQPPPAQLGRREFLRLAGQAGAAALAASLGVHRALADVAAAGPAPVLRRTAVVAGRRPASIVDAVGSTRVIEGLQVDPGRLQEMIETSLLALADAPSPRIAWEKFVQPGQVLLLKFSASLGASLGTEHAMLTALLYSLRAAGHEWGHIRVADCAAARYFGGLNAGPVGWSEQTVKVTGQAEQLRRYLQGVDAIINVPCLSDHRLLGVSCAMENVTLPFIRRPGRYLGEPVHQAVLDIALDGMSARPVALTIVNAIRCVFDGGPTVTEATIMPLCEVWASTDVVALDTLGADWLDSQRRRSGLAALAQADRAPRYLELAQAAGLGNADLRHIVRRVHRV